jgi:hypothetical protein
LIEDMKFQQNQTAFKEQIALLEQIKAKQLELERMQNIQYKQEKELLRKKAQINRLEKTEGGKPEEVEKSDEEKVNEDHQAASSGLVNETSRTITTNRSESSKKVDTFTHNMQERARMRELLKKEREEKRKKLELEKLEALKGRSSRVRGLFNFICAAEKDLQ